MEKLISSRENIIGPSTINMYDRIEASPEKLPH
jgi:hypothetical protein